MRCETDGPGGLEFQALWRDYGCISRVHGPSQASRRNHEQLQQDAGPAHKTPLWRPDVRVPAARAGQMGARAGASISRNKANTR